MDSNQDESKPLRNKEEKDLPGYPHYPPEEDIMNPQHGFKKIHADEELANSGTLSSRIVDSKNEDAAADISNDNEQIIIVRGTEADLTKEDINMLGPRDEDLDQGDDEMIRGSNRVDDLPNEDDLDVPGADLDDKEEELGEEDEENNYYSLGGDRHENLEEDQSFENEKDDQA